jgi:hypothetical protein
MYPQAMHRPKLLANLLTAALITLTLHAAAQDHNPERGIWHASSKTAKSLTGDIIISDLRITIDFYNFTIANIRTLTPAELAAAFDTDASTPATGTLYRLDIPGAKKFLHGSTLCAAEDTQWIVTYTSGKTLQLLFFSGNDMPVLTPDALPNNPNLCGLYAYTR